MFFCWWDFKNLRDNFVSVIEVDNFCCNTYVVPSDLITSYSSGIARNDNCSCYHMLNLETYATKKIV